MSEATLIILLVTVFAGSYLQAVTGFAMGLLIIAVMSAFSLMDIVPLTALVSLLSLVNVLLALIGQRHLVRGRFVLILALGQLPAIVLGVALLEYLNSQAELVLRLLLGLFIVAGSLSMLIQPKLRSQPSAKVSWLVAGFSGGLIGGMFSASAPVLGWFIYRQPFPVAVIRNTLLSTFAVTTFSRTIVVAANGELTSLVWQLFVYGLPVVALGTLIGRRFPPNISDAAMRRFAFSLMLTLGVSILISVGFS